MSRYFIVLHCLFFQSSILVVGRGACLIKNCQHCAAAVTPGSIYFYTGNINLCSIAYVHLLLPVLHLALEGLDMCDQTNGL